MTDLAVPTFVILTGVGVCAAAAAGVIGLAQFIYSRLIRKHD